MAKYDKNSIYKVTDTESGIEEGLFIGISNKHYVNDHLLCFSVPQPNYLFALLSCRLHGLFRFCDQELSPNHYRSILESLSYHSREII